MADIHESPAAGAVLMLVTLPESLAVTGDRSGPIAVLNSVPVLYHHGARDDSAIDPGGIVAAVNRLARVAIRRLGSGVDARQLQVLFMSRVF